MKKLTAQRDIQLVAIPEDVFTKHQEAYAPYYRIDIPGQSYKGVDEATPSFGLANGLVIRKSVPEELVYNMTKAIFDNLDALKGVHPAFGKVSKETILNGFGAPLHPGALKYYREIGVPGIEEFVKRTM